MLSGILIFSLIYTLLVFLGGFLCGIIRVPILEPLMGERYAQLLEMPVMMVVIAKAARFVVSYMRRTEESSRGWTKFNAILMGALALLLFLAIEIGLYLWVYRDEGKTWKYWIWDMDAVSGAVFFATLGGFAALPGILA